MGGTPHFLPLRYIAAYGELWARGRFSTRGRDVPDSVARCLRGLRLQPPLSLWSPEAQIFVLAKKAHGSLNIFVAPQ